MAEKIEVDKVEEILGNLRSEATDYKEKNAYRKAQQRIEDATDRKGNISDSGKRCANCNGYFDLPEDQHGNNPGLCPNRTKDFLPDEVQGKYYCRECIKILFDSLSSQASSALYDMFTPRVSKEENS